MSQTDTSRFAYEVIMRPGARESVWKKIIECLEKIKDGTNYEIAAAMNVKPEKVWKRTGHSELSCPDGAIFDTGLRRNSPEGNPSIVYALSSRRMEYTDVPKPERIETTTTADYASLLINSTAAGKRLIQAQMFEESEFVPCDKCDGHDACEDFGCAIELGLGKMLNKKPEDM